MSGQTQGADIDLSAVTGVPAGDGGVAHGERLVAFTDAAMGNDDGLLAKERNALLAVLSPEAFVDTCATIGAFNVVDRIADATGIPLDQSLIAMSGELREELDLARFRSSANTPGLSEKAAD